MSNGTFSNRLSFVGRNAWKAVGLAVVSAGLFLGGCNGKLKDENQALRDENAQVKEKLNATEAQNTTLTTQMQQTQAEKDQLARDLANAKTQPTVQNFPPGGDGGWTPDRPSRPSRPSNDRTFTIAGDTLFSSGSATLKSDSKRAIDSLLPQVKSAHTVRIEGYTDSDPIRKAKFSSNVALSKARADAVKSYLVSRGVSSGKISTVGKGAENPKSTKKDSRRVEIVVAE